MLGYYLALYLKVYFSEGVHISLGLCSRLAVTNILRQIPVFAVLCVHDTDERL